MCQSDACHCAGWLCWSLPVPLTVLPEVHAVSMEVARPHRREVGRHGRQRLRVEVSPAVDESALDRPHAVQGQVGVDGTDAAALLARAQTLRPLQDEHGVRSVCSIHRLVGLFGLLQVSDLVLPARPLVVLPVRWLPVGVRRSVAFAPTTTTRVDIGRRQQQEQHADDDAEGDEAPRGAREHCRWTHRRGARGALGEAEGRTGQTACGREGALDCKDTATWYTGEPDCWLLLFSPSLVCCRRRSSNLSRSLSESPHGARRMKLVAPTPTSGVRCDLAGSSRPPTGRACEG